MSIEARCGEVLALLLTDVYENAVGPLEFGDVFSASWMFDIHVRGDAVPLKPFECHQGRGRPPVVGYQRAIASPERDLVLSHGKQRRAVLLSDNCEIESVMVRRRRGRLVFAALEAWPANADDAAFAENYAGFRRHPLPPGNDFEGGVVNLQALFAVGQDAIANTTPDPRVARLGSAAAIDLEIRWNAYATRRGPLSHIDNAGKLARLLSAEGDPIHLAALNEGTAQPDSLDVAAANLLAEALTAAWSLEGGVLNAMAAALERCEHPNASRAEIIECLDELRNLADSASQALTATRRA